ncbi:MAG: hypothetical protein HRT44_02420 [Bdellovibrionales bacterium]|nr:hypothetical protein [Bdellovibrionales bacterium]NQZ18102.1 hypothetical protein [Bdellovibrionales bacterium]
MKFLIGLVFFFATLAQAQNSVVTGYWQTSFTNCGDLPMDQANSEDAHVKCQIAETNIEFNGRKYPIDPDRFYKIYFAQQHDDELAFLMWNGERIDLHNTEDHHINTVGFGIGQYGFAEWRLQEKFENNPSCPTSQKCHILDFYGLILGNLVHEEVRNAKGELIYPEQVVYQVYKLNGDKSCLVEFATDASKTKEENLAEARRYVDQLKDEDYCNL